MHGLYLVSVFLHLVAAMIWIGGMLFLVLVMVPLLRRPEWREQAVSIIRVAGRRFRTIGWASLLVLIVTGLFNLYIRSGHFTLLSSEAYWRNSHGYILAGKLVLVGLILILSLIHDLYVGPKAVQAWEADARSPQTLKLRKAASWMGRLNLLLALLVVALGVLLVRGLPG